MKPQIMRFLRHTYSKQQFVSFPQSDRPFPGPHKTVRRLQKNANRIVSVHSCFSNAMTCVMQLRNYAISVRTALDHSNPGFQVLFRWGHRFTGMDLSALVCVDTSAGPCRSPERETFASLSTVNC
jgi:hypothetical protein